eukprot:94206_1
MVVMFQPNRLNRLRQYITDDELINVSMAPLCCDHIYYNQCIHIIKKYSIKLHENKISTITLWDDLFDVQHTLRKQRSISSDSNNYQNYYLIIMIIVIQILLQLLLPPHH